MNSREDMLTKRIQKIKDWCDKNAFSYIPNAKGNWNVFTIIGKNREKGRLLSIAQASADKGKMYAYIADHRFPGDLKQRNFFIDELIKLNLFGKDIKAKQNKDARDLSKKLQDLTDDEFDKFLSLIVNVYNVETSLDQESAILHRSYGDYLPTKEDFEAAYRRRCSLGGKIAIDLVLDQIEIDAISSGHILKKNWRQITEKNIELWSKK